MENIMISNNITKVSEYDDAIFYKAVCDCMCDTHDQTLHLEYDKKFKVLSLNLYNNVCYPDWIGGNWFRKIWRRITASFKLLFTGELELTGEFIFNGEPAVKDYIKALNAGMKKLKENEKK
jgi:hypothetical protein